jgi:hypothetical protein
MVCFQVGAVTRDDHGRNPGDPHGATGLTPSDDRRLPHQVREVERMRLGLRRTVVSALRQFPSMHQRK